MPGFCISNIKTNTKLHDYRQSHMISNEMTVGIYYNVKRNTLNKFMDDKLFYQNDLCAIITEGVTLNRKSIMDSVQADCFAEAVMLLRKKNGVEFFKDFRGPFSGAFYDKSTDEWSVWTNHTGESSVFYYNYGGAIIIASTPNYIIDIARENNLPITLNEDAIISLLTYGYMYDNFTPANEVKRLLPGTFLTIKNNELSVHQYYSIPWGKYDLSSWSEEQIIEEIDKRFKAAVKLEYDKDLEYGYSHLADLSGGLDSRMATWVAKSIGYKDILNVHYSQTNSNEEVLTKEIVSFLGTELLFYPLDNHKFLFDAKDIIPLNYGLQLFSAITGGKRLLDTIDFEHYGLEHTGLVGDIVLGCPLDAKVDYSKPQLMGLYSNRYKNLLSVEHLKQFKGNPEKQYVMIRGLLGALSSTFIRHYYTEITSPFLNVDFMEFCFSIPYQQRAKHNLYHKWITRYYPEAADIRWTKDDTKITDGKIKKILRRAYYHGPKKIARLLGIKAGENIGMNPFAFWYSSDSCIEKQWSELVKVSKGKCSERIYTIIDELFAKGDALEKTQAVTASLAIDYWIQ